MRPRYVPRYDRIIKAFLILVFISQFFILGIELHMQSLIRTNNLSSQWEYTVEEDIYDYDDHEIELVLSALQESEWIRGERQINAIQRNNHRYERWFRIQLMEGKWENPALYFEQVFGKRFDLYVNHTKIYSYEQNEDDRSQLIVPLLTEYLGNNIYIYVSSNISRVGFNGDIVLGSYNYLLDKYVKSDFFNIVLGILLIILAIVIAFNSLILRAEEKNRWILLSIMILLVGLLIIMYSLNMALVFAHIKQYILTWFLICLLLLSLTMTRFFESISQNTGSNKLIAKFKNVQVFYYFFVFMLHMVNTVSSYRYSSMYRFFGITVLGIILGIQIVFIARVAIEYAIKGDIEIRFFAGVIGVFFVLSILDIIFFNINHQYYSFHLWKWGIFVSTIGFLFIIAKRFIKMQTDIILNTEEMKAKNLELDMMWRSLLVSEEHLRQITENTIDLISESDLEGVLQYVTPSHQRILGYKDDELVGNNISIFINPLDQELFEKMLISLKGVSTEQQVQVRFRNAEGEYQWLEIMGKLMYGTEDEPKGIIYSSRDITKRVKMEKSLRESEEKYRWLVDVLPDALYMRDKDTILFANRAATLQMGVDSPEELIGKRVSELFYTDPYCPSIFSEQMGLLLEMQSIPFSEEKLMRKKDGRVIDVEVAANVFQYNNNTVVLFVLRDIADRKKTEELSLRIEEKNRMLDEVVKYEKLKTDFFSNISHELRTPLNVILASVQMMELILKDTSIEKQCAKLVKYVSVTKQNSYRLIRLINNLIDITKMDAGFFQLNVTNANIVHIVEEITLSVADYVESRGLELIFDTEEEEIIIGCDPDKIERIMLNLLSNSIKFTDRKGKIAVRIEKTEDYVCISVEDTGRGIPEDKQQLIFERFQQVDWSFTRSNEGSGIGLSLIKSLVELHGGKVLLESQYGKGSKFIVQLPIYLVKQDGRKIEQHIHTQNIERIQIEFSDIYF